MRCAQFSSPVHIAFQRIDNIRYFEAAEKLSVYNPPAILIVLHACASSETRTRRLAFKKFPNSYVVLLSKSFRALHRIDNIRYSEAAEKLSVYNLPAILIVLHECASSETRTRFRRLALKKFPMDIL